MRSGTVVCPASQVRHACAAGPYGVRGSDPNRLSGMLDSPACCAGFSDPVSLTFCPYVAFRPYRTQPGSSAPHALKSVSAKPGVPIPNRPLLFQAVIPQHWQPLLVPGRCSFLTDSAQMMRAILFASATATSFGGFSAIILRSQGSSSSSRLRICRSTTLRPGRATGGDRAAPSW